MANVEALLEAELRGILPPDKKAVLDEARRRGLVGESHDYTGDTWSEPPPLPRQGKGEELTPMRDPSVLGRADLTEPTVKYEPAKLLSGGARLGLNLFPTMEGKVAWLSQESGLPETHFGNDEKGNIYYWDPAERRFYYAVSPFSGLIEETGDVLSGRANPGQTTMRMAGAMWEGGVGSFLPEAVGGTVGAATAPAGPWSIPAAGGAAALTDVARQGAGNLLLGRDPLDIEYANTLGHGLLSAGAQGLTYGVARGFERNPLKASGADVKRLQQPGALTEAEKNAQLARKYGVTVTPGESTGAKSLLYRQRQLGRFDESATQLDDFYRMRNATQLPGAKEKALAPISPRASSALGARDLQAGAQATRAAAVQARKEAAKPLYKEAFKANQSVQSAHVDRILETPTGKRALRRAVAMMQDDMARAGTPDPELSAAMREAAELGKMERVSGGVSKGLKLRTLDYIKRALWDNAEAIRSKNPEHARIIDGLRRELTKELDRLDITDKAGPNSLKVQGGAYARARGLFEEGSNTVTAIDEGLTGLAGKGTTTSLQRVPARMFGKSTADPISISQSRGQFLKAGKEAEWRAGLRSFLEEEWDAAARRGNPAKIFYDKTFADPRARRNLAAALGGESSAEFQGLKNFYKVLEMVAKAPAEGSPTVTDIGSRAAFVGPGGKVAGAAVQGINPFSAVNRISSWIQDRSAGRMAARMVDVITDPDALKQLQRLRMLDPKGQKALAIADQFLARLGAYELSSETPRVPAAATP